MLSRPEVQLLNLGAVADVANGDIGMVGLPGTSLPVVADDEPALATDSVGKAVTATAMLSPLTGAPGDVPPALPNCAIDCNCDTAWSNLACCGSRVMDGPSGWAVNGVPPFAGPRLSALEVSGPG
jgi:hypothetical protein